MGDKAVVEGKPTDLGIGSGESWEGHDTRLRCLEPWEEIEECVSIVPGRSLEGGDVLFLLSSRPPLPLEMLNSPNCGKPDSGVRFNKFLAFPGDDGEVGSAGSLSTPSNIVTDLLDDREGVRGGVVGECCAAKESSVSSSSSPKPSSGDTARIVIISR